MMSFISLGHLFASFFFSLPLSTNRALSEPSSCKFVFHLLGTVLIFLSLISPKGSTMSVPGEEEEEEFFNHCKAGFAPFSHEPSSS